MNLVSPFDYYSKQANEKQIKYNNKKIYKKIKQLEN